MANDETEYLSSLQNAQDLTLDSIRVVYRRFRQLLRFNDKPSPSSSKLDNPNQSRSYDVCQKEIKKFMIIRHDELFHDPDLDASNHAKHDNSNGALLNFPLITLDKKEKTIFSLVEMMRKNEIYDIQRDPTKVGREGICWQYLEDAKKTVANNASVNEKLFVIKSAVVVTTDPSDSQEDHGDIHGHPNVRTSILNINEKMSALQLLYPPLAVRTDVQRRTQIILLNQVIRDLANAFNDNFDILAAEKQASTLLLDEKLDRMSDILKALEKPKQLAVSVSDSPGVLPSNIIYETEPDGTNKLPISQTSKMEIPVDEDYTRALIDMMNGKLKGRKQLLLVNTLKREAWMDSITVEYMTQEQKAELEKFEEKVAKIEKQIAINYATLEYEFKTVSNELIDSIFLFNSKVDQLAENKRETEKRIVILELYSLCLKRSIVSHEATCSRIAKHLTEIATLSLRRDQLLLSEKKFEEEMVETKNSHKKSSEQDREMEKNFRKNIQSYSSDTLDQEMVDMLFRLFQNRQKSQRKSRLTSHESNITLLLSQSRGERRSKVSRYSGRDDITWRERQKNSVGSFRHSGAENIIYQNSLENALTEIRVGGPELHQSQSASKSDNGLGFSPLELKNIPEGFVVSHEAWRGVQMLRDEKILSETNIENLSQKYSMLKRRKLEVLQELKLCKSTIDWRTSIVKTEYISDLARLKSTTIIMELEQGQDEVGICMQIDNIIGATLVPVHLIKDATREIQELNIEKLRTLDKARLFRRKIRTLQWKADYLTLQQIDSKERHIDYQYLRIDKNLKSLLSDEVEESDQQKIAKANAQSDKRMKDHTLQVTRSEVAISRLKTELASCNRENEILEQQIEKSRLHVKSRKVIDRAKQHKNETQVNYLAEDHLMKVLRSRNQLADLLTAQEDEVLKTEKEIELLQKRTFPSFPSDAN